MSHNFTSLDGTYTPSASGVITTDYLIADASANITVNKRYLIPSGSGSPQLRIPDNATQGSWIRIVNTDSVSFTVYIRRINGGMIYHPDGTAAPLWGPIVINQYNGITFDSRGTVDLYCFEDDLWYAYYTPSIEMAIGSVSAGEMIKYNTISKQFDAGGVSRTTKIIEGNVSADTFSSYTGYETKRSESNNLTVTFPDYDNQPDIWDDMDGRDFIIDNKGQGQISLSIVAPFTGRYTYFRHRWGSRNDPFGGLVIGSNSSATLSADTRIKVVPYYFVSGNNIFLYYYLGVTGKVTTTVTTSYTVNFGYEDERIILVDNGANNVTITLADTSSQTWAEDVPVTIKRLGSGSVTVQCSGSDVVDGTADTSFTVTNQYDAVRLIAVASTGYYKI